MKKIIPRGTLNFLVEIGTCGRIWNMQSPVRALCIEQFEESSELCPAGQSASKKDI